MHAQTGLGRAMYGVASFDADDFFDLGDGVVGIGRGQIDFVKDGHDFDTEFERGVAVGDRLGLDAL